MTSEYKHYIYYQFCGIGLTDILIIVGIVISVIVDFNYSVI